MVMREQSKDLELVLIGLSHKTTPVEVRERIVFPLDKLADALNELTGKSGISEAVILSTCNRTEIYASAEKIDKASNEIKRFISEYHNISLANLNGYLYEKSSLDVVKHIYMVVSSLDSQVIGEAQILGQVKDAYSKSLECKAAGPILNQLFKSALSIGKKVRASTGIGESAVSISYAAVELAKRLFDDLSNKAILLIGAGEMGELTAKHLVSNGVRKVFVTNRTLQRAMEFSERFNGEALPFEELIKNLSLADIVITSTGAPGYVVNKSMMADAMKMRKNRPVFLIDIAVPRDIDPGVDKLYNAYLYNIDDLKGIVEANMAERQKEAEKAQTIIDQSINDFYKWSATLDVVPAIAALKQRAEDIKNKELKKAISMLNGIDESQIEIMDAMAQAMINKLLHSPIVKMKTLAAEKNSFMDVEFVEELFGLNNIDIDEENG